jgi:hypothetical protein
MSDPKSNSTTNSTKNDQERKRLDDEDAGEGNRTADRHYREATERYVADGKVDHAAKEAERALDNEGERRELERAEQIGRSRAKEPDPETRH